MLKSWIPLAKEPIDVYKLYDSERCQLISIIRSGKKKTPGVLHFKGLPTLTGEGIEVHAVVDGVVTEKGFDYNIKSRTHRRGALVSVRGRNGITISYERLSLISDSINVGDYIKAGDLIGWEGNSGSGKDVFLALRFLRNGRLVDGCYHLGIPEELAEFRNDLVIAEDVVCKLCGLDSKERYEIRSLPCADSIWCKILKAFSTRRVARREGN